MLVSKKVLSALMKLFAAYRGRIDGRVRSASRRLEKPISGTPHAVQVRQLLVQKFSDQRVHCSAMSGRVNLCLLNQIRREIERNVSILHIFECNTYLCATLKAMKGP